MDRFIKTAITLSVVILVSSATFGIQFNHQAKVADMPAEIRYEIIAKKNIWPDQFYVDSYYSPQSNGYWTFEYGSHPLAGMVWVYHPSELNLTDFDFAVHQITR